MNIKQKARAVAEELPPGRIPAADLHLAFRRAFPEDSTPQNVVGQAFREIGLHPTRTVSGRFWVRPDDLPPLEAMVPDAPQPRRILRSYLVHLQCLQLSPGDTLSVSYAPDAITIRKATA